MVGIKVFDVLSAAPLQVGIRCVKLEGSMSLEQRNATIHAFSNDPDIVVFLMSLKAGGVALNLTAASHVMLMDPWWNPVGAAGHLCTADCGLHVGVGL
jgi:DNA repair protein RAD16